MSAKNIASENIASENIASENIASLAYVSTASPKLSADDLRQIADTSARNNAARSVTGLLGYNGSNFIQILEGSPESVGQCIAIIEEDKRHSGLIVISRRNLKVREFPDWAMHVGHYVGQGKGPDTGLNDILAGPDVSTETRNLFKSFRSLGNRL